MRRQKRLLSFVLSLIMTVTIVFGASPFSLQAFAAPKSDGDMIMNFDLGYGSGSNTGYSCKDYFSNSYMKTHSWSNNASATTVDGSRALYNQNGYIYTGLVNSKLYGGRAWRLEFKFQKNGDAQDDALLIALGSATTADGIYADNTSDLLTVHQGGYVYVCNQEINDAAATAALKLSGGEAAYYSILFNAVDEYLTITKNGQIAFEMHLSAEQIAKFQKVGFLSMGCHASTNDQIHRGWYTGTIDGYYYYVKAYAEPTAPETAGKITVDPVIYTHGEKTATQNGISGDYGWMMYGTQIADGTVNGEQKTSFSLPNGAVLEGVYCPDSDYLEYQRGDSGYYLTGSFSPALYQAKEGTEVYAPIRFAYTLDGKSYVEWHSLNVKTNPVPTHGMLYVQSYQGSNNNKSAVAFQTVALGSVGPVSASNAKFDSWGHSNSNTRMAANSWNIFDPYSLDLRCSNQDYGSIHYTFIGQSKSSTTVDKTTGYAATASRSGDEVNVGIETEYAKYYVDRSADSILGAKHNAGEDEYTIQLFAENLSESYAPEVGPVNVVQNQLSSASGANMGSITDISTNLLGDNSWTDAKSKEKKASETVTLKGNVNDGSVKFNYWIAGENQGGKKAKGTIITFFDVTVFDKTASRNLFSSRTVAAVDSGVYDAVAWREYRSARLAVESRLNNYELSAVDESYTNALTSKYQALGTAADYSALIVAIQQAEDIIAKPEIYTNTETLQTKVGAVKAQAFNGAVLDGNHLIKDQSRVDSLTTELMFVYTETVLNRADIEITLNVYLDNELKGSVQKHGNYNKRMILNAAEAFADAAQYEVVNWTHGGVIVATEDYD